MPGRVFSMTWNGRTLEFGKRTLVMGVLNVTPDSFADGGRFFDPQTAVAHGLEMARQGADILDVGGESTRPYSEKVDASEEIRRVVPVVEQLASGTDVPISIDTTKAETAREALRAGASMINDVSALRFDEELGRVAAETGVPLILMHMKGHPKDMQVDPVYDALIPEILEFLDEAVQRAQRAGVSRDRILVDPGIGFGKTFDHNLQILRGFSEFETLGLPVLLGCSRKAFLGKILDKDPDGRDVGTMAAVTAGVLNGAHVVRVHNVPMAVDTVRVADAILRGRVARDEE